MGSPRIRRPDVDVVPIDGGDTLTLKKYLTAAELRTMIRASTRPVKFDASMVNGKDVALEIDPTENGLAMILAYLVDWTFTDFDGKPIVIRDQPESVVRAALDAIDADTYVLVNHAVQVHDTAMKRAIEHEKKVPSGPTPSGPI